MVEVQPTKKGIEIMLKGTFGVFLVGLALLLASGTTSKAAETACESMDRLDGIAYGLNMNDVVTWYALQNGFFAAECLEVNIVVNGKSSIHRSELAQGTADFFIASSPVEGMLGNPDPENGVPVFAGMLTSAPIYTLIAYDREGPRDSPPLTDLLGQYIGVYGCSWQGTGDITDVYEKTPEMTDPGSSLTDMLIYFLRQKIAEGELPADTKIYCTPKGQAVENRQDDTIYIAAVGGGGDRFKTLMGVLDRLDENGVPAGDLVIGMMVTAPGNLSFVPTEGKALPFSIYAGASDLPFSDGYLVAMSERLNDPAFRDALRRFMVAHGKALADLRDRAGREPDAVAKWLLDLSTDDRIGGSFKLGSHADALWALETGLEIWDSRCPRREEVEEFITASGGYGGSTYESLVDCVQ